MSNFFSFCRPSWCSVAWKHRNSKCSSIKTKVAIELKTSKGNVFWMFNKQKKAENSWALRFYILEYWWRHVKTKNSLLYAISVWDFSFFVQEFEYHRGWIIYSRQRDKCILEMTSIAFQVTKDTKQLGDHLRPFWYLYFVYSYFNGQFPSSGLPQCQNESSAKPFLGKVRFFLWGEGWGILVFFPKESLSPPSRFDENARDPPLLGD